MGEWYTGGDSVVGSGVRVEPPMGWPKGRRGGRPSSSSSSSSGLAGGEGWSVGGTVYRTWGEAWRGAVRPVDWPSGRRVPTASAYLHAWSLDPSVELGELIETIAPQPVAPREKEKPAGTPSGLGIDLERRGVEVRKLLHAGFGLRMTLGGYDPADVLQEVYRGILVRNRGKCPFDPKKSSFGHYVHMVIDCVLSNYHRREKRRSSSECSWEDFEEGRRELVSDGVGQSTAPLVGHEGEGTDAMALMMVSDRVRWALADGDLTEREATLALKVLPLIHAGHPSTARGARECGWSESEWRVGVLALRRVLKT